jgi:hypothetical protein
MLLVGTADGLFDVALDGATERRALGGATVDAVAGDWAIADGRVIALESGAAVDLPGDLAPRCLAALDGGRALVGTSDARLLVVGDPGGPTRDAAFDGIPARAQWSVPWGGAPDTRSIALAGDTPYVAVHVGGLWRRGDDGWAEVVPADADVHQVVCSDDLVAVAAGTGVGFSDDGGETWQWSHDGLHGRYCRSVALAEGWLLAGASTGPGTNEAAVYRRPLDDTGVPFARCENGLPRALPHNVDTGELVAAGGLVAVGTPAGDVFLSEDGGGGWRRIATALPGVRCLAFTA